MQADPENQTEAEQPTPKKLLLLFTIGFAIIIIGTLLITASAFLSGNASTSSSVIIFIGPFPIVFGSGPDAVWLISIGVLLALVSVVMFVLVRRKMRV